MDLDQDQARAVDRCIDMSPSNRVVPVSGEAGTGKTSILAHVYRELESAGYRVVLCAPTGKAAKRIHEATGIRAMTIHRLLEYPHPGERGDDGKPLASTVPKRDKQSPIRYNVVLADEYMMVNRELHANLVAALPPGGVIRMFGDVNQLKPIEHGRLAGKEAPFEQAIRRFDGVILRTIHRTGAGSGISENGRLILKGRIPKRRDDFLLHVTDKPVNKITDICMEALDAGIDFGSVAAQMITPTKKSWVGTYKLNLAMQKLFNPMDIREPMTRHKWESKLPIGIAVGDKVIWTENAYDLRDLWDRFHEDEDSGERTYIDPPDNKWIMNGETGVVTYVNDDFIGIDVGDRQVDVQRRISLEDRRGNLVTVDMTRSLDLAYAVTTHKAQGSEWDHVMYVLNRSTSFMQSRHNLYTGVSRARQHVHLVTDQQSLSNSVFQVKTVMERKADK